MPLRKRMRKSFDGDYSCPISIITLLIDQAKTTKPQTDSQEKLALILVHRVYRVYIMHCVTQE